MVRDPCDSENPSPASPNSLNEASVEWLSGSSDEVCTLSVGKTQSRVLVLSAHSFHLDRRIASQINSLAASGKSVTLVSIPTEVALPFLHESVRVVMPSFALSTKACLPVIRRLVEGRLPGVLEPIARGGWAWLSSLQAIRGSSLVDRFFLEMTPDESFDIVHCHDLNTLPAALKLCGRMSPRPKLIYDAHELYPYQRDDVVFRKSWSLLEKKLIGHADLVITVNDSLAEELKRMYHLKRVEVIYNACEASEKDVSVSEETFLDHFGSEPTGFRVIFQGNLSVKRNLKNLVRAFGMLGEGAKLFLLGRGTVEGDLRKVVARNHIRNVFFGDWVPQHQLLGYLANAHIGVIPYQPVGLLNNLYCTPNKLFEFIEAGLPICASDLPELRGIISGSGIGRVYPMATAEEIADAIADCIDRCGRGEFTETAASRARDVFGWARQQEKLLLLYDELGA